MEKEIIYKCKFTNRTTVKLEVQISGQIMVYAPNDCNVEWINGFVEEHYDWIRKEQQKNYFAEAYFQKNVDEGYVYNYLQKGDFSELITRVQKHSLKLNLPCRRITIKNMLKRWGSCNRRGDISINWKCMVIPDNVRDYLIIHELCHIKEFNHSKEFYKLIESYMPDYKDAIVWLQKYGNYYLQKLEDYVGVN
jgi:hypothetical protein